MSPLLVLLLRFLGSAVATLFAHRGTQYRADFGDSVDSRCTS
jgi:hypothetical protein